MLLKPNQDVVQATNIRQDNLVTGTVLAPNPSTISDFQLLGLCKSILNRSSITVARMHLMPKVLEGKITGNFWATNREYYSYSISPDGKIDYRRVRTSRQSKSASGKRKDSLFPLEQDLIDQDLIDLELEVKEDAPRAGRIRRKKQFECTSKSTPCKGICIPKSHTCRDEVNLSAAEKQQIEQAIASVDKYAGRSLRDLQKEGSARGVYRTNHKTKAELIQTLKTLDQNPQSQENLRRTLNKRKKNRDVIIKAAPKELQKTYKSIQTVSKVYKQNPDQAGLIIAAGLLGISTGIAARVRDRYKDGLRESAEMALAGAQKIPVDNTRKNDILFAVGGYAGLDSRGERMRDLLLAPQDNTAGEKWLGKNNHIIPFNHAEFNVQNPGINKRGSNGNYNPVYLGFVAKSSFGQFLQNHRRGRNEAAVDLAAQLYAYGNRYPKANLNVVAHGSGGNITDEATEILGRMRRLKSNKPSGQELIKRLNIVRLGTNYFGHTNDKRWRREVEHRTIASRNDPFSFLPKKRPQWISTVKGGEVDDYLKNPEVRERLRESFNYYSSSMKGSVIAHQRRQETRKAVGEVLGIINPGFGTLWNQVGRIQDKARDNPAAATAMTAALVTGVGIATYKNAQKRYREGINEGAKVAQNTAKNMRVDNPHNRNNITFAVGGTGESAQEIIDNLPAEIKGSGEKLRGGKTHLINTEEYGISSADVPSYLQPGTRPYYAYLAANGFGGELKKGVLGKKVDPEAVQLAALLFAHGQKNFQNNRSNYQLNMIASGDGALKARAAMEILSKMGSRGQAIARNVQLASLGSPGFGITNEDPGTPTRPKYVSRETSFMGTKDFFNLFPDRKTATTFRPDVGHGAASYLKDESVIKNLSDILYPPPKRKSKPKKKVKDLGTM